MSKDSDQSCRGSEDHDTSRLSLSGLPSEAVPLPTGAGHTCVSQREKGRGEPPARSLDFGFPVRLKMQAAARREEGRGKGGDREEVFLQ